MERREGGNTREELEPSAQRRIRYCLNDIRSARLRTVTGLKGAEGCI